MMLKSCLTVLETFRDNFETCFQQCWNHVGTNLGPSFNDFHQFRDKIGTIFQHVQRNLKTLLGPLFVLQFGNHCDIILGSSWDPSGIILGSFRDHFRIIWDHLRIMFQLVSPPGASEPIGRLCYFDDHKLLFSILVFGIIRPHPDSHLSTRLPSDLAARVECRADAGRLSRRHEIMNTQEGKAWHERFKTRSPTPPRLNN